jgi:hypothetical protein
MDSEDRGYKAALPSNDASSESFPSTTENKNSYVY